MSAAKPLTTAPSISPASGGTAGRFLRASFTGRTWAELLYALIGLPLGVAGFVYVTAALYAGGLLAITFVGLPLVAAAVLGARAAGELHRKLARRLLGVGVGTPARARPKPGLVGWLKSRLGDATGWRAMLYLVLKLPVAVLTFVVAAAFWAYGVFFLAYPALRLALPLNRDLHGRLHRGIQFFSEYYFDTWPRSLMVAAAGVAPLLAAPWAVRGVLTLDRLLVRGLLGPTRLSQRVRDLEATRAHMVDDSAAALRRIERDLHDGVQARLVALAMKLGLAREEIGGEDDPRVLLERTRALIDTAHSSAKQTIVEVRDLARGIHPPVLDSGLGAALATLAARSAVPVELHVDVPERPSPAIETIAYFCTAELLTNVAKHSGARRATIAVTQREGVLRLQVTDDGRGGARIGGTPGTSGIPDTGGTPDTGGSGDARTGAGGSGLVGLAERVRTVDGRLHIDSPPGGPTVVTVELPSHI